MTRPGLTEQELAVIRADIEPAVSGPMVGVPAGGERYAASVRVADQHALRLLAHVDVLTAQLAEARRTIASYGSPVLGGVPAPKVDEGQLRVLALRAELERTGTTSLKWADGHGLCPEGPHCTAGLLAVFPLTSRGRLPVHRITQHSPQCQGTGKKPLVVLRYVAPEPAPTPA
ncbi:hypothetical protein [Kitasatospora aureofaciens]|uniref:hypothetical protein n=1 Tax=Kitasatospora aureofaciens TaxID=1894 RepID=UPI0033C1DB02